MPEKPLGRIVRRRDEARKNRTFSESFYTTCLRGFKNMSTEATKLLRSTIPSLQGGDGFFLNRAGREDLYYTFFGVFLSLITQSKIRRDACRRRIASVDFTSLDLVHRCAFLRVQGMLQLLAISKFPGIAGFFARRRKPNENELEKLRSLDNLSVMQYPQRDKNSPYSRFLIETTFDDFGLKQSTANFDDYRLPNGLFANLKNHPTYGVNATAASLFLLPDDCREETVAALALLQQFDGSFKAVESAVEGDLLSTATAVFALQSFEKTPPRSIKQYLRDCFRETGLFAATPDDPFGDLEYTVYGLLAMGTAEHF